MSSILDALKKAEQESVVDRGKGTPWPAPPADGQVDGPGRRRVWIPVGLIVVLFVVASVFWLMRRPVSDLPPAVTKQTVEPLSTEPFVPANRQRPSTARRPAPVVPSSSVLARPPQKKPSLAATPPAASKKPPPRREQKPKASPQPMTAAPALPTRQLSEPASVRRPSTDTLQDSQKVFRSDARVDLQALVWAPETADRFVVINNRLIREGGSIDNITVVRIHQDDVLLSEGADRWYQPFTIR